MLSKKFQGLFYFAEDTLKRNNCLFLLLFFVSCGPEFVRGNTGVNVCPAWTQYGNKDPNGQYIFGTGSGMVPEEAENAARTGIASYFRVTLTGQNSFTRSEQERDKVSHTLFSGEVRTSSKVSKALDGVGILKRCFCDGRYWALAGLDIEATRRRLLSVAHQDLKSARIYLSKSIREADPLAALGYAGIARSLLSQAMSRGADMFVLGAKIPKTMAIEIRVKQQLDTLRKKVVFVVYGPEPAKGLVIQSITGSGLQVVSGGQQAQNPARVKISLDYRRFRIKRSPPDFLWSRLVFSLRAQDLKTDKIIYKFGPVHRDAAAKTAPDTFIRADYIFRTKILPKALKGLYNSLWRTQKGEVQ